MKEQFVNYDIAQVLKELGFNVPCICGFNAYGALKNNLVIPHGEESDFISICKYDNKTNAPLHQQVIDWFREEHQIYIGILPYRNNKDDIELCWYYTLVKDDEELSSIFCNADDLGASRDNYNTPEEARDVAILNAIKIVKDELDLKK